MSINIKKLKQFSISTDGPILSTDTSNYIEHEIVRFFPVSCKRACGGTSSSLITLTIYRTVLFLIQYVCLNYSTSLSEHTSFSFLLTFSPNSGIRVMASIL